MSTASLTLESQAPPSVVFPAPLLNPHTGYTPFNNSYDPPSFPSLDIRHRLSSSSTYSTGMAPGQRGLASLPTPTPYNSRAIYAPQTPLYRSDHNDQRSPSFGSSRRLPLSPTPSPNTGYSNPTSSIRMDHSPYAGKGSGSIPPLLPIVTHGQLAYQNGHSPISTKVDIHGMIDKGFFMSDGEWTCYRRNYFSCMCSFSLTPNCSGMSMQYTPNGAATTYNVAEFAMTISAVVAESDAHTIDLVQHTPKRDKGPISRPEKVSLSPKQLPQTPHPLGLYPDPHRLNGGPTGAPMYGEYSQPQGAQPTEHTFERIQFKQATANNGKRRAAQQYYHLVIELHARLSDSGQESWQKIAYRKSAKMIVRGRSPGHYQQERRGSTSSGPGGAGSTLGSYSGSQGPDYTGSSSLLGSNHGMSNYDSRSSYYGSSRHHDLTMESLSSGDGTKEAEMPKPSYQYYGNSIYEGNEQRPRMDQRVEMFVHRDQNTLTPPISASLDASTPRLKNEIESTLPSLFYPGPAFYSGACRGVEGKSTSAGCYPTMLPQSS